MYNSPIKFIGALSALLSTRSTSEYKVQVRSFAMLLEYPMHVGALSALEQIAPQMELSRISLSMRITLGSSVVTILTILYFIWSSGINLSSFAPQFFSTTQKNAFIKLKFVFERIVKNVYYFLAQRMS